MLNHSFETNCFFHWRLKDRMLEVMINAGKRIKKGDENPWDVIQFSGNARIHLDSFLSVFNIQVLEKHFEPVDGDRCGEGSKIRHSESERFDSSGRRGWGRGRGHDDC
ncbi:hypothetical protein ACE6H2_013933 [Prunus campanulata]